MHSTDLRLCKLSLTIWHVPNSIFELNPLSQKFSIMSATHTYPPETAEGHKRKTTIFSMNDIAASASKENPELFRMASVGGQPSHRETYSHSSFTARQSNQYGSPNPFGTPPPDDLSHNRRTGIFDRYREDLDPQTPAPQPASNGGQPVAVESNNSRSQTDTPTHATNRHDQGDEGDDSEPGSPNGPGEPGGPGGPGGPNVLEDQADPPTTLLMSKTSCGNS